MKATPEQKLAAQVKLAKARGASDGEAIEIARRALFGAAAVAPPPPVVDYRALYVSELKRSAALLRRVQILNERLRECQ